MSAAAQAAQRTILADVGKLLRSAAAQAAQRSNAEIVNV